MALHLLGNLRLQGGDGIISGTRIRLRHGARIRGIRGGGIVRRRAVVCGRVVIRSGKQFFVERFQFLRKRVQLSLFLRIGIEH